MITVARCNGTARMHPLRGLVFSTCGLALVHESHGLFRCPRCCVSYHFTELAGRPATIFDYRLGVFHEEVNPEEVVGAHVPRVDREPELRS